jgi:hypothetical protein
VEAAPNKSAIARARPNRPAFIIETLRYRPRPALQS